MGDLEDEIGALRDELRTELREVESQSGLREERLNEKLDKHWKDLSKDGSARTKHLHERIEASNEVLRKEIDAKVGKVSDELRKMPGEIIAMLRDTSALNAGGVR
jgi:hypothetical protein